MINWRKHYKKGLIAIGILLSTSALYNAQEGDPAKGAELFKTNCTACHKLDSKLIRPPLKGIVEKVKAEEGLGRDWFQKWIKDNKALRASGDKYANKIFEENGKVEMQQFPNLSEKDIDDILAYTSNPPAEPAADAKKDAKATDSPDLNAVNAAKASEGNAKIVMISLFAIAGLLIWILFKIRQLVKLNQSEEITALNATRIQSFSELYAKYKIVGQGVVALLAILAAYGVWNWLMWIGVYKGYKPEQPIYFSHKIHAGINKIDCQLCHSGAKYGKVSEIPSLNVCMNCHKAIPEYKGEYLEPGHDRDFYNGEIKKLYAATGWDPAKMAYTKEATPVEWTRIHNMPDFVYFNHSQHVIAGEQAIINSFNKKHPNEQIDVVCKACHGKIDTMNVVQMANDFTMGWCIECHRTTEVDMGNTYNQAYFEKLHDKLKKQYGSGAKITVDAIGGIECGKCHY
ncbi:c-type cytochrome [Elizabethkingia anophelis]